MASRRESYKTNSTGRTSEHEIISPIAAARTAVAAFGGRGRRFKIIIAFGAEAGSEGHVFLALGADQLKKL